MLLGHLFLEAHNSYFETVNVRGQISVHIFARYRGYNFYIFASRKSLGYRLMGDHLMCYALYSVTAAGVLSQ